MNKKTRGRKTHRSKSHKRRHTRRTGGACPCSMRQQLGGRGGMGGAELGHAYTTSATSTLNQTNPAYFGGGKGSAGRAKTRAKMLAKRAENRAEQAAELANRAENMAEEAQNLAAAAATTLRANAEPFYPQSMRRGNTIKGNIILPANKGFEEKLLELNNNYSENNVGGETILPANKKFIKKLLALRKKN